MEKRATGVTGSINFQVDWLNSTNHERISILGQQTGKPNKCRFHYFHAWLSARLKGEEEEIRDTSAELAAPLLRRRALSLLCRTEHLDAICLSSSEDLSSAVMDKEMGGLWIAQPAPAIHCCSSSGSMRVELISHSHAHLRQREEDFASDDFHRRDQISR